MLAVSGYIAGPHPYDNEDAPMLSFRNSTKELSDSGLDTAIISVESTEQCGPYLPLHIDKRLAEYFARAFGEALNAYVLPTLPFNTSEEHSSFRGMYCALRPTTVMAVMEEIVSVLREQGFRKQVLTVGHGGCSYWRVPFIKHINWLYKDIVVVDAHHGGDKLWEEALVQAGLSGRGEVHGGAQSRALALYLAPEYVREGEFGKEVPEHMKAYMDYSTWDKITGDGSWGKYSTSDSDVATAEAGRILLEYFVKIQSKRLKEHLDIACRTKGIAV
jgi:creatinine amidohydrolase